jgi:hypothetical protein
MLEINWTHCATKPRDHQMFGVKWLLKHPAALLADEVGAGKSKQIVDTSQILFQGGEIDAVVVDCPAAARGVWADPDPALGEVSKHGWPSVLNLILEYSVKTAKPGTFPRVPEGQGLLWLVTNYEFVRREERLVPLLSFLTRRKFWLVCDEAWALKDQGTEQWKAAYEIRKMARRVTLLNGTPIADSPLDMNAQMRMLDENILGFPYINARGKRVVSTADSRFKLYYAGLAPCANRKDAIKQEQMWKNLPVEIRWPRLEELRAKCEPFIIRRETRECFDLPPVLDPVLVEARMTDDEWRLYRAMKKDMVAWLGTDGAMDLASVARQAFVKALRLAQITGGFLGGVERIDLEEGKLDFGTSIAGGDRLIDQPTTMLKEIGRSKLDALIAWLETTGKPNRLLVWGRFRAEIERAGRVLAEEVGYTTHLLYGGQTPQDRQAAVRALNPDVVVDHPVAVVGSPQAGGAALNLSGASVAVNLSHDFNLRAYLQARGRIDRPGQKNPIRYVDVVAVGPKGERTIDHHILAALRSKQDIASWTAATWRQKLSEE